MYVNDLFQINFVVLTLTMKHSCRICKLANYQTSPQTEKIDNVSSHIIFGSSTTLDRSTMHPKFDLTGV